MGPVPPSRVRDIERNLRTPNVARICDHLLGGASSFEPDREEAGRLLEICPELGHVAQQNRGFLTTAATWAVSQGIRQFVDLGAGYSLPRRTGAAEVLQEIHEAAQAVSPAARCVYVDSDPVVLSHSKALRAHVRRGEDLEPAEGVTVAEADLREPGKVLANPEVLAVIDPAEPVCLVFGLVLGLMPAARAREVVAGYADLIAPGSCVVISCARVDDDVMWKGLRAACTATTPRNHTPRQMAGFLAGLELLPPGLAAAQRWRGGWGDTLPMPPGSVYVLAAVARKP